MRRSTTSYGGVEIAQDDTEAISLVEPKSLLVVEITPYPSLGIAQVVRMTHEQSKRITDYTRKSRVLKEVARTDLLLDITYVPQRNWSETVLRKIPAGTAIFPVVDVETLPIEKAKKYLS